jgi:hypothetical protein
MELSMSEGAGPSKNEVLDLLGGRPGWRLEPSTTPGTMPMWCFVFNGKIEFSLTADGGSIRLYVMDTDREIVFKDADGLMAWLRTNRVEAVQEPTSRAPRKSRFRKLTEWS